MECLEETIVKLIALKLLTEDEWGKVKSAL
jgi:hypothetical protein